MHPVQTLFSARHSGDEIATQRLPAVPAPRRLLTPTRAAPAPARVATLGSLTPPAQASPGVGCHGSAHTAWRPKSISALAPRAPTTSSWISIGRSRRRYCRADAALCAAASSALRPQDRLPPPPPGASARAEPDGHPGTGGRRASRTSLEPGEQRSPSPWGTLGSPETERCIGATRGGVPTPGSPALRGR